MRKRNVCKILLIVFYLVLVAIFTVFAIKGNPESDEKFLCIDSACVRFCKDDHNATSGSDSSEHFEITNPLTNLTQKFRIINGEPCEMMKLLEADQWIFSSVS